MATVIIYVVLKSKEQPLEDKLSEETPGNCNITLLRGPGRVKLISLK